MTCINGQVMKNWSIHAGRSGAEKKVTAGEESLDDLEAGVSGHAALVEHAGCPAESASMLRKGDILAGARHKS